MAEEHLQEVASRPQQFGRDVPRGKSELHSAELRGFAERPKHAFSITSAALIPDLSRPVRRD